MPRIVTLTLNPCIDRTIRLDRPDVFEEQTGGKGVNVARVLGNFGMDCVAVAPVGRGENSVRFRALAAQEGIKLLESPVSFDVRRIDTYWDPSDNSQRVDYAKGTDASEAEINSLRSILSQALAGAVLLIVSGSAPGPNLSAFAGEAIRMAKETGVETLLDSNGPALTYGLAAGPGLIKPNQAECAQILRRKIAEGAEDIAAEEILSLHAVNELRGVIVSMGERGAVWAREGGTLLCPAPKIVPVNAVGSGDSFVAALCWALLSGYSDMGALTMACAAGAANAAMFPAARVTPEDMARVTSGDSVPRTPCQGE